MLYFVIPLRDPSTTNDWPGVCQLLRQTLRSACGQLYDEYRVIIVGHSLPDGFVLPQFCEFLPVGFDPPKFDSGDGFERKMWLMRTDKGRKILHGLARAREEAGSYVMFLDADDLVSNRLAGFVAENPGSNGWYFEYGYRMDIAPKGRRRLYWRRNFYQECGSSYILRADLAPFPDKLDDRADFSDYFVRRYEVHAYIRENFEKLGIPLFPLPFYGAIYTFNGRNIFAVSCRRKDSVLRLAARNLIKRKPLTMAVCEEFGVAVL